MPRGTLAVEPFIDWADDFAREVGTFTDAEARMDVDSGAFTRGVCRLRRHEAKALTLPMVDKYFTAADQPHKLAILYPLNEPAHDQWCETCHEVVTTNDDLCCPWCESETTP
jgi:hypothetical protein